MKRNRNVERALQWHFWKSVPRPASIIPPKSVVRLKRKDEDMDDGLAIGDTFRIGYYGKQNGPNCVWLVDAIGNYVQTWDQKSLLDYFEVVTLGDETDTYGTHRPALGSL